MSTENSALDIESPKTDATPAGKQPAKKKSAKKKSLLPAVQIKQQPTLEEGAEILFKVKRLHGFHGTVLDVNASGGVLCRINEDALEGELVVFSADQLVPLPHASVLTYHNSTRLPWDYKS